MQCHAQKTKTSGTRSAYRMGENNLKMQNQHLKNPEKIHSAQKIGTF
jgi:hypothetical protein